MRRDFHIENEANLFLLYAVGGGAPDRTAILRGLRSAARNGWAVPVELVQDDSFNIRFVDEDLNGREQAEWVGKIEWNLRVPGGVLALQAGSEVEVEEENTCRLEIPPGDYHVTIYAYFPGVNGLGCLRAAGNRQPFGQWFRRTRPEEEMSPWLTVRLAESPSEDPGHEQEWESFLVTEGFVEAQRLEAKNPTLDFVVHLCPLEAGQSCQNKGRGNALPYGMNAREPERFPLGLAAEGSALLKPPDFVFSPRSPEARRLLNIVPEAAAPVKGGPLHLPLSHIHHLAGIPVWCHEMIWALLLVEFPEQAAVSALGIKPTYYIGIEEGPRTLLVSLKPKDKMFIVETLKSLGQKLIGLPEGAELGLITGDYAGFNEAGNHRYRGMVRGKSWIIEAAYPEVQREVLQEAVEFAGCLDEARIQCKTEGEAKRVLEVCRKASAEWYDIIKPRIEGAAITIEFGGGGELWNVARYAFAMRYAAAWAARQWLDEMFPDVLVNGPQE
jgi:hypothetical protein